MTESQRKNAESQRKTLDRETVIRGLEQTAARLQYGSLDNVTLSECEDAVFDALTLLREQKPVTMKPYYFNYVCSGCGSEIDGEFIDYTGGKIKFCPECGRKVKWDAAD